MHIRDKYYAYINFKDIIDYYVINIILVL